MMGSVARIKVMKMVVSVVLMVVMVVAAEVTVVVFWFGLRSVFFYSSILLEILSWIFKDLFIYWL